MIRILFLALALSLALPACSKAPTDVPHLSAVQSPTQLLDAAVADAQDNTGFGTIVLHLHAMEAPCLLDDVALAVDGSDAACNAGNACIGSAESCQVDGDTLRAATANACDDGNACTSALGRLAKLEHRAPLDRHRPMKASPAVHRAHIPNVAMRSSALLSQRMDC